MKRMTSYFFALCFILTAACKKEQSASSNGAVLSGPAALLVISDSMLWNGGNLSISRYEYDSAYKLIALHSITGSDTYYYRDKMERIVRYVNKVQGDSSVKSVFYADQSSRKITYAITHYTAGTDSMSFQYNADTLVEKIEFFRTAPGPLLTYGYSTFSYDLNGNLLQLLNYSPDSAGIYSLNIGYSFTYDQKINPFYSTDDIRLPDEWSVSACKNNVLKQTNIYGDPPKMNSDYVTYSYQYLSSGVPKTSIRTGTAIADASITSTFTYR